MFVSSVEVTSLRSTSAASLATGQNATSSRFAGRFSVAARLRVFERRARRRGALRLLAGQRRLEHVGGLGVLRHRDRAHPRVVREIRVGAPRGRGFFLARELHAVEGFRRLDRLGGHRPGVLRRALRERFRRDGASHRGGDDLQELATRLVARLVRHGYFFSLKFAGMATSSAATVGDTDRISCDDVKTVPRWVTSPLGPIIFFASMPPMPPPVVGGG